MKKFKYFAGCIVGLFVFLAACEPIDNALPKVESDQPDTIIETDSIAEKLAFEFDQYVAGQVYNDEIPGAAAALIYEGEIVLLKGYGFRDLQNQFPATPDTLFHIASTQKSMTAMLIATLVDDGIVEWDTPLVEISPEFELGGGGESITLRHLLSMSSGIPDTAEDDFYEQGYEENAFGMWPLLASTEPLGEPGEVFSYSNISSSMAGYAAVLATNPDAANLDEAFGELLFERVIRPIGMDSAVFSVEDARKSSNYGKSYVLEGDELIEAETEDFATDTMTPSGVVKASAADMALYIQTQLNQGVAPNGERVVSAENMTEMWEPQFGDGGGDGYALGWSVIKYISFTLIYHEGSFDNYESVIGFVPEFDVGFVVLTNASDVAADLIANAPWVVVDTAGDLRQ